MKPSLDVQLFMLIVFAFATNTSAKHKEFRFYNYSQVMNKNYVTDVLMIFKCPINSPEDPCKFTPKISGVLLQNLVRPYIYFRGFDVTSNKTFLEQKLSLCSVDKKAGLNIFIRLLLDQVTEFIKFDCPIQKQFYEVKSFRTSPSFDLLLNFFAPNRIQRVNVFLTNKVGKNVEDVYALSIDVTVNEVGK